VSYLIPLFPLLFLPRTPALVLAIVLSALVLFGVGAYQAVTRVGSWWKQGPRMVLIGLGAAAMLPWRCPGATGAKSVVLEALAEMTLASSSNAAATTRCGVGSRRRAGSPRDAGFWGR
jgi:hypothetical protein